MDITLGIIIVISGLIALYGIIYLYIKTRVQDEYIKKLKMLVELNNESSDILKGILEEYNKSIDNQMTIQEVNKSV